MAIKMKIKVLRDGPLLVTGDIPLFRKSIVLEKGVNALKTVEVIETKSDYHLCRCGLSENKPFCDGTHKKAGFSGTEVADKTNFIDRSELITGEEIDLLDDDRCAYARFCHRQHGSVWDLTIESDDPGNKKEAIEGASLCPSGRLVSVTKKGEMIEEKFEPAVSILQDPEKQVSAGFFITGYIPLEDADGQPYEERNRVALCRCGQSRNKPFCDATHVSIGFRDGHPSLD